jgi:hypothetical protein
VLHRSKSAGGTARLTGAAYVASSYEIGFFQGGDRHGPNSLVAAQARQEDAHAGSGS